MPHIRYLCMLLPLIRPSVRHLYVLLPFVMPHVRHMHLGLLIVVSLKGRIICIWSFGCGFAFATTMGCAGFRLSFGIIILPQLLTIIK